jgi:hypothetical protein
MHAIALSLFVAAPALVSAAVMPLRRGFDGFGTWYITTTGNAGSCGSYLSDGDFTVAVNSGQYNQDMCGKTVTITANGKTTQAKVADECPIGGGNCNNGDLDMSPALFSFFASQNDGKIPISWDFTDGGAPPPAPKPEESKKPEESAPAPEETKKHEDSAPAPESTTKPQDVTSQADSYTSSSSDAPVAIQDVAPTPSPSPSDSPTPTDNAQPTPTPSASESAPPPPAPTPAFGKVLADAMGNQDVPALAQAFIDLGNSLKGSTPAPDNGDGN